MSNVAPRGYNVTAGDMVLAVTGLAVAFALAWISLDLMCGGRLTLAVTRQAGPPLRVVGGDDQDDGEADTG